MVRITKPLSVENLVKISIKANNDLSTLEKTAKKLYPSKISGSMNWFVQKHVDDYLEWYTALSAQRQYSKQVTVDGEQYEVPNLLHCRQKALWKTYRSIAEANGVNTESWHFDPRERDIGGYIS